MTTSSSQRAPTFVLLHGFAGAPASWDAIAARLPARARVLCPALVGHTGPPTADAPASFAAEVERLARLITAADMRGAHVCGYSLGGRLALGLLAHDPGLAARVTVIGAHPGLGEDSPERGERAQVDERWAQLLEREGAARFADDWAGQPLFATQKSLPPPVYAAQQAQRAAHEPRGLAHALRALSLARMPDLRPALAQTRVPVTFMAGALDEKFVALADDTAAILPAGRAHVRLVPGAGHNLLLERPAEVAAEIASAKE
jgi:2-succinyl-6-hydroxy-2,4-cyclohexadiene-1-carboxylate synthase